MRPEGFQRAIGKPFGRARRRETFCICKNAYKTCKKNEANSFVSSLGRVAESNFCGTPILQTNQEKNGGIASKSNQPKRKEA